MADDRLVDRQQIELVHINIVADEHIEHAQMTKITKDINNFRYTVVQYLELIEN